MKSDELYMGILHAAFINKDFIGGEECCNYEKYLLELINSCIYFREKSKFEEYAAPNTESNGECDCNSEEYSIDFKLLESTTRFHASKELTGRITVCTNGGIVHGSSRKPDIEMKATVLHSALRGLSCESLHDYLLKEYEYGTIDEDIKTYVKSLSFSKNLLFFFPYRLSFKKHYNFRYAIEKIMVALKITFKESNYYRKNYCKDYDTYLSFVYDDNLIVCKFEDNGDIQVVDIVYLFKSKTYKKIYDYVNF